MGKYILFLCGGKWQLPWFLFLKEKGFQLILVDPYKNSPCVIHADVFFQTDVKNVDLIYEFIKKNGFEIEFVTSEQTDVSTLPIAYLSEKLGTKANSIEAVEKFSNKYISRSFLKEGFFNHYPQFCKIKSIKDLVDFKNNVAADIIVKPADSQSSRGVVLIEKETDFDEIDNIFHEVFQQTTKDYFLAEEFVKGTEITLEGLCFENNHVTLTGSEKTHFRTGIASNLNYPLNLTKELKSEIIKFHNELVIATGLQFGITHSEYIVDVEKNKFWLIEMACRGGGSLIPSQITPWVSGIEVYDLYYKMIVSDNFVFPLHQQNILNNKSAKLHFFEFKEGVVTSINGVETCKLLPNVFELTLLFKEGDHILSASDDSSRQGFVIILAENEDEINDTLNNIYKIIEIGYSSNI